MELEIVYKMPLKGTVRYTTAERRGIAHLHNEEMERKYGWSPDGYPGWHDGDGRNKEYPLPYSPRYFYRFVHLFFSHDAASSIVARLEYDFKGDTADAFYIKALLARAEECNLFTPGAAVVLYADKEMALIETWEPGQQINSRWAFSFNTFHGSKANRANRKLILNWLKLKAKESPVVADVMEAVQSAPPNEEQVRSFLIGDKSITRCDAAALKIGLVLAGPLTDKALYPRKDIATPRHLFSNKFTRDECEAVLVAANIIYDREQGYGLRKPKAPAQFWGAVQALVNNQLIIGEVRATFDKLADLYAPTVGRNTDYKEQIKGNSNMSLRDGRIQTESALIDAKKLDRGKALYHTEEDKKLKALTPR